MHLQSIALMCICLAWARGDLSFPSPVIPNAFGVNIHFTNPQPGEMDMLAAAGFTYVRMDLDWAAIEQTEGDYDFSAYDVLASNLDDHNMRAILILDYSNPLYDGGLSPQSDTGRAAFAAWAVASVTHFQGKGYLWEMYNEPNGGFWKPTANVTQYTELALVVGKAVKSAQPDEIYIGPTTSTFDWDFINATLEAGLLEYFDCWSIHPYRPDAPETATPDFAQLRQFIDKYSPQGKFVPIISSEWGYSTLYPNQTLESQGKVLPRMLMNNLANNINLSIWYDWHDDCSDPTNDECHFGTVFPQYYTNQTQCYDPKPNYISAKTLMTTLAGFSFSEVVNQPSSQDYVFSFANDAGSQAYAAWTLSANHTISFSVSGNCYNVTDYLGGNGGNTCSSGGLVKLDVSDGPIYLIPQ